MPDEGGGNGGTRWVGDGIWVACYVEEFIGFVTWAKRFGSQMLLHRRTRVRGDWNLRLSWRAAKNVSRWAESTISWSKRSLEWGE